MRLTENQRALVANSLAAAAELYKSDACRMSAVGNDRLQLQFENQAREAEIIGNLIAESDGVVIEGVVR